MEGQIPADAKVQEIVLSSLTKWVHRYPELIDSYVRLVRASSFYVQLSTLNKFKLEEHLRSILG
jgi:hypothetical protein